MKDNHLELDCSQTDVSEMDDIEIASSIAAHCEDYSEWLEKDGTGYTYAEMATQLRAFADLLDAAEDRWNSLESAD